MASDHILYELECGEVTFGEFDDVKKLTSHCFMHNKREIIIRVQITEWIANCTTCSWRRWCGNDKMRAQDESRRHWGRHPQHNPVIGKKQRYLSKMAESDLRKKVAEMEWKWYNGRVVPGIQKEELPDEPPF